MATGKSTWKRNKLLTARRNYFNNGGGILPSAMIDATQYIQNNIPATLQTLPGTRGALQPIIIPTQAPGVDATQIANGVLQGLQPLSLPSQKETAGDVVKNTDTGWAMGGITGGVGFLADATTNMVNNINASGVKAKKKELLTQTNNAQMKGQPVNDSFDSLANDMSTTAMLKNVDKYDLGAKKGGAVATEAFTEGLKGSMAGFNTGMAIESLANGGGGGTKAAYGGYVHPVNERYMRGNKYMGGGPIGAIVGGVLGTGMSLIGNLINNHKAKKAAQEVNEQIAYTNDFNNRSMMNRANNLNMSQLANLEQGYYAFGGELNTQGLDFTNGLLQINEGGSHEANPLEGVLMGIDAEGAPNLVEEGETIYNDYVFSNRLVVPKAVRSKYKLRGTKDMTFAEASKKMAKESEERPNDPISQRGLEVMLNDLAMSQEMLKENQRQKSIYANGGKVNKFDGTNPWKPSKLNRYGYIAKDYYGLGETPTWIQDGSYTDDYYDFIDNTYDENMFRQHLKDQFSFYDNANKTGQGKDSNRYKAIKYFIDSNKDWYNNRGSIDTWDLTDFMPTARRLAKSKPGFMHPETVAAQYLNASNLPADPATPVLNSERGAKTRYWLRQKDAAGTPLDPIEIKDYDASKYTYLNTKNTSDDTTDYTDHYYDLKPETSTEDKTDVPEEKLKQGKYADWLRYAPAVGFGIGTLTDLLGITNKPDYSNADLVMNATRGSITPQVGFKPIGNYLARQPLDREFYINQLNAQSAAGRRAIAQNAGLNRGTGMAAILAADNNAQNQLGLLARQAEEYNREDRHKVEEFNKATNMFNSEGFLKADMANQSAAQAGRDFALRGTIAAAEMRERARNAADAAKSANLSGLFQTLGDIGYEEKNARMRDWAILHGVFGPGTWDYGRIKKTSKGGKIKRKGLTV